MKEEVQLPEEVDGIFRRNIGEIAATFKMVVRRTGALIG